MAVKISLHLLRRQKLTGIGLGDSGAHTSQTCDASFPTFILAYWVREKKVLSLEQAVRKLAFDPALMWGLHGRGLIARGAYADLNVIDLDGLDLKTPQLLHQFPAGAPHLTQESRGYAATIVNGKVLMRDGVHSGALAGRVLRTPEDRGWLWLLDDRYRRSEVLALLPAWWQVGQGRGPANKRLALKEPL